MSVPSKTKIEYKQPEQLLEVFSEPHEQFHCHATVDVYEDCSFGCVYCPVLRTEPVPGENKYLPRIGLKTNAPYLLKKEMALLKADRHLLVGAQSDPYQPLEKEHGLTRQCLEELIAAEQPFQIMTKSDGILRDLDLLRKPSEQGWVSVTVSLSTLRREVHELLEPHAPSLRSRLRLIKKLSRAGLHVGVALMPIIPLVTDRPKDMMALVRTVKKAGAQYLLPGILRLPNPEIFERVLSFIEVLLPHGRKQYEELYQGAAFPSLEYQDKILNLVRKISDRYHLPTHLPVEGAKEPAGGLVVQGLW